MAFRKKTYGSYQEIICLFCGQRSTSENPQGLPVCRHHKNDEINLKCVCGEWLDVKKGKYGAFFVCMNCGPVNYRKGLEINNLPLRSVDNL